MLRVHYCKVVPWKSASHLGFQELVLSIFVINLCSAKVPVLPPALPSPELAGTKKVKPVPPVSSVLNIHPNADYSHSKIKMQGVLQCWQPIPWGCTGTVEHSFFLSDKPRGHIHFFHKCRFKEARALLQPQFNNFPHRLLRIT